MKQFHPWIALAQEVKRQMDSSRVKELVGIFLSLIAAVRCFLAQGYHTCGV